MNKLNVFLEQLDLSEIEASLFTALLDNGPMSVRDLAVITKMKRTTAYFYIDQLVEKGLVVKLSHGTQKLVTVSQPKESLQYLVDEKEKQAQQRKTEFPDILKAIRTTLPKIEASTEAEVKYYKGQNGVKKIYEEALAAKELRSYVNIADVANMFPKNVFSFDEALQKNKDLVVHELVEDSPASREQVELLKKNKHYNVKFLPKTVDHASDILIYVGKVATITVRENISGVLLHMKDYHDVSKELFDFTWNGLALVE